MAIVDTGTGDHDTPPVGDDSVTLALPGQPSALGAVSLDDKAGDPACWAGLLCPECGIVLDGRPHQEDCSVPRLVN